ncbi:hypothetical protein [Nisaea sp.]|jgi:hypothetical protein|uniref:hypothetical protein n=1 Tax=Nisaea sp. TaxID=2024842 RepID=UPI003B529370
MLFAHLKRILTLGLLPAKTPCASRVIPANPLQPPESEVTIARNGRLCRLHKRQNKDTIALALISRHPAFPKFHGQTNDRAFHGLPGVFPQKEVRLPRREKPFFADRLQLAHVIENEDFLRDFRKVIPHGRPDHRTVINYEMTVRRGNGRSLGPRSPDTEERYGRYHEE